MQCTHKNNELIKQFIKQNLSLGKGSDSDVDIKLLVSDLHNVCTNMSNNYLILQGILPLPQVSYCCKDYGFCVASRIWRCNGSKMIEGVRF